MAETSIQYKVMILYMLDKAGFPLTNSQISGLILEKEYTNYFTLQQTLSELENAGLLFRESSHNATIYRISNDGRQTLLYFSDKISDAIKQDILNYFQENAIELRQETSVIADYFPRSVNSYQVRCQVKDNDATVFELNFTVTGKEQAVAACSNWKSKSSDVYAYLMDMLIQ